jgi:transposase-like protein
LEGIGINLPELIERFGSEDKCHAYLASLRWPEGVRCLECGSDKIGRITTRRIYECSTCRYQFSVRKGTIFEDSKLPLWKWFLATYLVVESKKGVSANQIKRMIGVSYKTAWYLCHRIRAAMVNEDSDLLGGIVEVDETWVGGETQGKGRGFTGNKTLVASAIARGGDVRLRVIKSRDGKALGDFIAATVDPDAEAVFTDDFAAYKTISALGDHNTRHETGNHNRGEWVRGEVHSNTAESVFSLMKRSIVGSYHQLSAKHLPAYLAEMEFRFNGRENPMLFRDTLNELVTADPLRYRTLTADAR